MYHPRLKGKHYDMGYHYGELLGKKGVSFDKVIDISPDKVQFGIDSLHICEKVYPEVCEEIRGLSEGLNCAYEKFAAWLFSLYCFADDTGCTCFCYKSGEHMVFARNGDMFSELKKVCESVLYRPDHGYYFVGHSTGMVVLEDGLNEKGLAAGMTFILAKHMKPGLNAGFLIRYLLEKCSTVQEALYALEKLPISSTQNIILADKSGEMKIVECSCNKMVIREPKKHEKFLIATNHFLSDTMQSENGNPMENWYHSNDRYETVYQSLKNKTDEDPINYACDILSGKKGFVCQYEKSLDFITLWSTVYDLNTGTILCVDGNPSRIKYKIDDRLEWGLKKRVQE